MKVLNIDYQIGIYSVEVNNCIDYNIAGAVSFFKKDFFQLYCGFWGLFSNFYNCNYDEIRNKILNIFELGLSTTTVSDSGELISLIKQKINDKNPVLVNVPNSVLFYSIMYKNPNINKLNHSFIINGYDDEREVFYIRENSINTELLSILTPSQPFSEFYLTYDMMEKIYYDTKEIHADKKGMNFFFQFVYKKKQVNINKVYKTFINYCIELFSNINDLLYKEIENIFVTNTYSSIYSNEQFRRTTIHSMRVLCEQIKTLLPINEVSEFTTLYNEYIKFREKIVNILAKNSIKKSIFKEDYFVQILNQLKKFNIEISLYCKKITNINKDNEVRLSYKNVIVTADSEFIIGHKVFSCRNILSQLKVNNHFNFWMSKNDSREHWIKIDFNKKITVKKIIIKHRKNIKYITKDFELMVSIDNIKWQKLINVEKNNEVFNEFNLKKPISFRYFMMKINEPNNGIDNCARISNVDFFN